MTARRVAPGNSVRENDKFMLRLPDGMRGTLKAEAERNNRSMNAEIVARLERTMRDDARAVLADRIREVDETGASAPRNLGEPLRYEPDESSTEVVSDFEREFVQATHEMMLRLMRKHGMNPVDSRELLDKSEDDE